MEYKLGKSSKNSIHKHYIDLFDTWTETSIYLLGYLEADGTVIKRDGWRVCFTTSEKDADYLEMLKELTGFTGKTTVKTHHLHTGDYKTHTFTVSSRQWQKAIEDRLRIQMVPDIPDKFLHHYIRGYFDGDGSIYFCKQISNYKSSIVFSSEHLAEDFRQIVLSEGIKVSHIHQKTNSEWCWYFQFSNKQTTKLGRFMYQDSSLFLNRKYQLFNQQLELLTNS